MLNNEDVAKKSSLVKILIIAISLLLVAVVVLGVTVGVMYAYAQSAPTEYIVVSQDMVVSENDGSYRLTLNGRTTEKMEQFDKFVCSDCYENAEFLLGSFLFCEEDKDIISHRLSHFYEVFGEDHVLRCSLFLGEIDNEDYVMVAFSYRPPEDCEICKQSYMFKSNLGYKLGDVVKAFEAQIGEELSKQFLCALPTKNMEKDPDLTPGYEQGYGIMLSLLGNNFPYRHVGFDKYQTPTAEEISYGSDKVSKYRVDAEYFYAYYNDQLYIVTRGLAQRGYVGYSGDTLEDGLIWSFY